MKFIILKKGLQILVCVKQSVDFVYLIIKGGKGLPELLVILSNGTTGGNESDDTLAMACQAASCLFMRNPEMNKNLLNNKLINSLNDLSKNM